MTLSMFLGFSRWKQRRRRNPKSTPLTGRDEANKETPNFDKVGLKDLILLIVCIRTALGFKGVSKCRDRGAKY